MKRVAIVGAGPAGLAAAKALSLEPVPMKIDLYERRNGVGGLWNYNKGSNDEYISAMYNYLETNLQPNLMEYADVDFVNPEKRSYPTRRDVFEYLVNYYKTIDGNVNFNFNCNVEKIIKQGDIWKVDINGISHEYEAIVIANGHFDKPYVPEVDGLSDWKQDDIIHSRDFVDSSYYHGQNVLVVGNSHSGIDIATQVYTTANKVFISGHNHQVESPFITLPFIKKYDCKIRSIVCEDGQVISNIDKIIFCTGYEYDFPFLPLSQDFVSPFLIKDLYKQVFYIDDPSLAFLCLNKGVVPMPLSEAQASVVARVFSGRIKLPSRETMEQDFQHELASKGSKLHDFGYPLDVEYYQQFMDILDANPLTKDAGLIPRYWGDDLIKERSQTSTIKQKRIGQVIDYAQELKKQGQEFKLLDQNV